MWQWSQELPLESAPATAELLSDPERRAAHLDALMLKRIGTPKMWRARRFSLASDDSAWVTGINVMVDGGYSAR